MLYKSRIRKEKGMIGIFIIVDDVIYAKTVSREDVKQVNGMRDYTEMTHLDLLREEIYYDSGFFSSDYKKIIKRHIDDNMIDQYFTRGSVSYNEKEDMYYLFSDSSFFNDIKVVAQVVDLFDIKRNNVRLIKDDFHYSILDIGDFL